MALSVLSLDDILNWQANSDDGRQQPRISRRSALAATAAAVGAVLSGPTPVARAAAPCDECPEYDANVDVCIECGMCANGGTLNVIVPRFDANGNEIQWA